jgi:hypothetical protein
VKRNPESRGYILDRDSGFASSMRPGMTEPTQLRFCAYRSKINTMTRKEFS